MLRTNVFLFARARNNVADTKFCARDTTTQQNVSRFAPHGNNHRQHCVCNNVNLISYPGLTLSVGDLGTRLQQCVLVCHLLLTSDEPLLSGQLNKAASCHFLKVQFHSTTKNKFLGAAK